MRNLIIEILCYVIFIPFVLVMFLLFVLVDWDRLVRG